MNVVFNKKCFIYKFHDYLGTILKCARDAEYEIQLSNYLVKFKKESLVIGPEGGFRGS